MYFNAMSTANANPLMLQVRFDNVGVIFFLFTLSKQRKNVDIFFEK